MDLLWRAVDGGSWVTPQLFVVAYFTDPQFPQGVGISRSTLPAWRGRGRRPKRLRRAGDAAPVVAVRSLAEGLPSEAWQAVSAGPSVFLA